MTISDATYMTDAGVVTEEQESYKLVARYKKARTIADALAALPGGTDGDALRAIGATEVGRELAAQHASAEYGRTVRTPSATTWALVVWLATEEAD